MTYDFILFLILSPVLDLSVIILIHILIEFDLILQLIILFDLVYVKKWPPHLLRTENNN